MKYNKFCGREHNLSTCRRSDLNKTCSRCISSNKTSTQSGKPVQKMNLQPTVKPITKEFPTTVIQALKDPRWCHAMYEEINGHFTKKEVNGHIINLMDIVNPNKHITASVWSTVSGYVR